MRVRAYIDGFNLYNRILRRSFPQYKWLDPHKLASLLSPTKTVDHTLYFTARVKGFGGRDTSVINQQIYLRAIDQNPNLTIHHGQFTRHAKWMRRKQEIHDEPFVEVWRSEEKGSDVNLASNLLCDAFQDRMDLALIITNDSDFAESIQLARTEANKIVVVYSPQPESMSKKLREVADEVLPIRPHYLRRSQLPKKLPGKKKPLVMPDSWLEIRNDIANRTRMERNKHSGHL